MHFFFLGGILVYALVYQSSGGSETCHSGITLEVSSLGY